jgi:hypothetical protein
MALLGRRVEAYTLLRGVADEAEQRGLLEAAGRALNNLSAIVQNRNPQEAGRIADRLGGLLARAQHFAWLVRHAADIANTEIDKGLYEEASIRLAEFSDEELTPFWQRVFRLLRAWIDLRRTGSEEAFARAWEAAESFDDETDPQIRAGFDLYKASLAVEIGDWERCFREAEKIDPAHAWWGVWFTAAAAAWLGDIAKLERAEAILEECPDPIPGLDAYLRGIRRALDGDATDATECFTTALDVLGVRLFPTQLADARATFARVVGTEVPAAAHAARQARDWLEETGTQSLLAVWGPALPTGDRDEAAVG